MGGVKKRARSAERRRFKEQLKKTKCRILAHLWDPRIKGCCFVNAKAEQCCAIPLQVGTTVNATFVCLLTIVIQAYYCVSFAFIEYYYATDGGIAVEASFCGGASSDETCLTAFVLRLVGDVVVIILCVLGVISAPCEKINPNMLETRHCQTTTFFIGLCVAAAFHVATLLLSAIHWGSDLPAQCFNATQGFSAPELWGSLFCQSTGTIQAVIAAVNIVYVLYVLYVMLITLSYRGWLIVLHLKHFKGFKDIDFSDEEEEVPKGPPTAKVTPVDDELENALADMLLQDAEEKEKEPEPEAEVNAENAWQEAYDEDGNVYYTNYITGESAWSIPSTNLEEVQGLFEDVIDQSEDAQENVETVYKRFRNGEGKDGLIDYSEFCKVLQVDANEQVKKLFDLFDHDNSGKLTIKEFVVGVCNFTGKDTTKKVEFAFRVFDENDDGYIDVEELCQILRAIHMAQDEQEVQRKAKLIMKKSDTNNDGVMSFDEFVAISKKFPNILFPAFNLSNQLGEKLGFT